MGADLTDLAHLMRDNIFFVLTLVGAFWIAYTSQLGKNAAGATPRLIRRFFAWVISKLQQGKPIL